jgi:hypothetical protein
VTGGESSGFKILAQLGARKGHLSYANLKEMLMECSAPGTIHDEELLAYLAGERVSPAVPQHLAHCQSCKSKLADYRRIEHTLIGRLYRWNCPPNQILGEYELGLLSAEVAAAVKTHLSTCALCAAEVATLADFLADDATLAEHPALPRHRDPISPPSSNSHGPAHVAKRALDQIREQSSEGIRRIVANLLPPQPRYAYQRDVGNTLEAVTWPRRYSAEDVSISISVERETNRRDSLQLIGFVTRNGAALEALQGLPVILASQANIQYAQNVDELGNFVFSSVVPATYTLELQFPDRTIVIDALPVAVQD